MRHSTAVAIAARALLPLLAHPAVAAEVAGRAGWAELESVGAVRPAEPAELARWIEGASRRFGSRLTPDYRLPVEIDSVLTQNLGLPPNLPARNVLVPAGVTTVGDPGPVCLFFLEGFRVSADRCLGDVAPVIARLDDLDRHPPPRSCRVLAPDPTTSIQAASVEAPRPGGASGARPSAQAHVSRRGEVLLVLNSATPVDWRVTFARGALVRGAILTGSAASTVDGLDPDMPLLVLDEKTRDQLVRIDALCAPFVAEAGPAVRGGPDALVLDRQIRAITGRGLDGLHGSPGATRVDIR